MRQIFAMLATAQLCACGSLLPSAETLPESRSHSFEQLTAQFATIKPYETRDGDLRTLGLHPEAAPNIAVLGYADVLARYAPGGEGSGQLDDGIRDCLAAKLRCVAYRIDILHEDRQRVGNFWADFLGFKHYVDVTGWHFVGLVVLVDGTVVYKDSGGTPSIHRREDQLNPLGPLQGLGESLRPALR